MTDHDKLMVALVASSDGQHQGPVTLGDIVAVLYELGAQCREQGQRPQLILAGAS